MSDFQSEKQVVRAFHSRIDSAAMGDIPSVLASVSDENLVWYGYHPIGRLTGALEVAERFWQPLRRALTSLQRREDVFFAGRNEVDGFSSVWVVSMGHLMGLFDAPWLNIQPTGKLTMLRYCTFHRVAGDQIVETAMYFDIPHLMRQAGQPVFGTQTAQFLVQPGPQTHDGLLYGPQPATEATATLNAINAMISDMGTWNLGLPLEEELRRTWHEDMLWWGPEGIGATFTIERYAKQHSGPFRAAFSKRTKTKHIARLAEGNFGGFFGWPNFSAALSGNFMGKTGNGQPAEFRVVDIYRRQGSKLAENWIFIDMLHFWKTQGIDVLAGEW